MKAVEELLLKLNCLSKHLMIMFCFSGVHIINVNWCEEGKV